MNLYLQLRIMFATLSKNRLRSLLAIGVMGIGIAAVMIVLALSMGARLELEAIVEQVGKNLLLVKAGKISVIPGRGGGWFEATSLDLEDSATLREDLTNIMHVIPIREGMGQVKFEDNSLSTTVRGTTANYLEVRNYRIKEGRFFDELDNQLKSRVAVVSEFITDKLSDSEHIVGKSIEISTIPFIVIGELENKGSSADGSNEDNQILIPLNTALQRVFNVDYLSRLLIQTRKRSDMKAVKADISEILRENHRLADNVGDDFEILELLKTNEIRAVSNSMLGSLARFFAVIALAIGGVGVLSITYLNVKERTSEVGLRKAVGAKDRDIAFLFLSEACLLSSCGGVLGLVLGWLSILIADTYTGWELAIDANGVLIPFAMAFVLGLLFGVYPAINASRLEPVKALAAK